MKTNPRSQFLKYALATSSMLFALANPLTSQAQEHNFVLINPTDSPADIVKKAAHVTPSARQFKWQRQELTAFLHFGTLLPTESGEMVKKMKQFSTQRHLMQTNGYVS